MKPLLFIAIALAACSKQAPDHLHHQYGLQGTWNETTVKKGDHRFSNRPTHNMSRAYGISYWVLFQDDARYYHTDPTYQDSWNKAPGITYKDGFCNGKPQHSNSALVGWRWFCGRLELGWYLHGPCGTKYQAGPLATIEIGKPYLVQVWGMPKGYWLWRVLEFTDTTHELGYMEQPMSAEMENIRFGDFRNTFFWFGGQYPAMHDITILFDIIKPSSEPGYFGS